MTQRYADTIDKTRLDSMPESTEVVVMVDKDDNEIGTCTRKEMRQFNKWHRATSTIILSNPDEPTIYYQVRDDQKDYCPGYYDLGFGGVVTIGESYLDCALRETRDESGIDFSENDLVEVAYIARDDEHVRCHYKVYVYSLFSSLDSKHIVKQVALYDGTPATNESEREDARCIKTALLSDVDKLMEQHNFTKACELLVGPLKRFVEEGGLAKLADSTKK
ncbi:hydrolase, NUDIX family protein, putative [Babesia bigemina]|uniref:Hydrolase, NUDIX family protein, putative n=1 Tax=Babesia bigemina TaxID=5866 RepID=A0A061DDJ3_BABBI|nr:hydrolase, NUDIX family protein, putative [Babesia bigemina]CDR96295.1 hydrolase, NUDIX family protein, putative [Babesia bigemina]|eukprot:XP_012768481.1 hydrolase, NUDIX family protein, putative [Babesia bigemina]